MPVLNLAMKRSSGVGFVACPLQQTCGIVQHVLVATGVLHHQPGREYAEGGSSSFWSLGRPKAEIRVLAAELQERSKTSYRRAWKSGAGSLCTRALFRKQHRTLMV